MPFVEALRQFQFRVGKDKCVASSRIFLTRSFSLIHVCLVPVIGGEQKTKPTQASIRDLRGLGLTPDLVRLKASQC